MTLAPWPYPFWIAHRGAGTLAPENTLAAFRVGASHGYRMFECDAKLSADGVAFLLHDSTLERTTDGHGVAGAQPWARLAQLDAGSSHSRTWAGEPMPTLAAIAHFCRANRLHIDIEIKPTPGAEEETGHAVALAAERLWQGAATAPLLTSFSSAALASARRAAPALPRGLLLDRMQDEWPALVRDLECSALICNFGLWNAALVAQAHAAGCRALSYTVNEAAAARRLIRLGTDGIITNRIDRFAPA